MVNHSEGVRRSTFCIFIWKLSWFLKIIYDYIFVNYYVKKTFTSQKSGEAIRSPGPPVAVTHVCISMFSYFENRKTTYFHVLCLNFRIETKIKTFFLISYFNLSKKTKWHFGYTDFIYFLLMSDSMQSPMLYGLLRAGMKFLRKRVLHYWHCALWGLELSISSSGHNLCKLLKFEKLQC